MLGHKTKHPHSRAEGYANCPTATHPTLHRETFYQTWTTVSVRYSDLDPNHHVNNGAINQYFEDGRVGFRLQRLTEVAGDTLGLCRRQILCELSRARALSGRS